MNFYLCLASLCLGLAAAIPPFDRALDSQWHQWKAQHGKSYEANEDSLRRATWEKNLKMIERHNQEYSAGKHSFQLRMNKFGDMSTEEFKQVMNGYKSNGSQRRTKGSLYRESLLAQLPESVDWREKGYVTPVKEQGDCGACWSFSAVGAIEGQWFRKTGKLVSLSIQNLIDCTIPEGNNGCDGGFMDNAFQYVQDNGGIDTEECYPYVAQDTECKYKPECSGANITGFVDIPSMDERALMEAVATVGPISVGIDSANPSFKFYQSGVYYEPDCSSSQLDHGVLVVGYGSIGKDEYWIVKNSWGEAWGDNGYILMAKDKDNHCGIATEASYPKV
ncbi:procathepsin L-like [Monodelphis domestica]|uniref:Cathepsin L1-like n=1 Tax=Monodelphis domestica TaxID=13616 RepID=A0A5F8GAM4_MONDO|nr:procathepsin L-like [Monodelphis domestica]